MSRTVSNPWALYSRLQNGEQRGEKCYVTVGLAAERGRGHSTIEHRVRTFEASASALGYAFQLRFALRQALDAYAVGTDWAVGIETADDLEVLEGDSRTQLQLKHTVGTLTDACAPLWTTLRIWALQMAAEGSDAVHLVLLSTGDAAQDSAAYYLAPNDSGHRDESLAFERLANVVASSTNSDNRKAYEAFKDLSEDQQRRLIGRITVLTDQSSVLDIEVELRARVVVVLGAKKAKAFIQRLEGWWFQRCLELLAIPHVDRPLMTGPEFDTFVTDLRSGFVGELLPIDQDIARHEEALVGYLDRCFVLQLRLITDNDSRILTAVRDYYRAFTQRSRWVREHLVTGHEVETYERRLVEQWRIRFDQMIDELGKPAAEEEMSGLAKRLYAWVESEAHHPIRPGVDEPFLGRGSYQILADDRRVGWHPEFEARLLSLLEPATGER